VQDTVLTQQYIYIYVCVCVCVCVCEIGYALITDRSILERCLYQDTVLDQNVTSCVKVRNQCVFKLSLYRHIS
jgi:hypothetical protein